MSQKHKPQSPAADESTAPYGTETARPRWILCAWIVLYAGWLVFLIALALRHTLRS